MGNIFNPDFQEFILELNRHEVRYMLVGGYSVILYGYSRTTGDMDIWVERSGKNYQLLAAAFQSFGMPVFDMTEHNFLRNDAFDVFTFGRQPSAIDIIVDLKGLAFEDAYLHSQLRETDGINVRIISRSDLIAAKKASGRYRDLDDIENL